MKVMKFGGTSVGSADGIRRMREVITSNNEQVIVVVSALQGVTDKLLLTAHTASEGDPQYKEMLRWIVDAHYALIDEVILDRGTIGDIRRTVDIMIEELTNILKGVYLIKDLSDKSLDTILSYGERLSSIIVAGSLKGAVHLESRNFIKTQRYFERHVIDFDITNKLIVEAFREKAQITVVGGFIASDAESGDTTNLGRGGSDYTASVIAAALNAIILEIWTDVDGFMTADPKVINTSYLIDRLSFVEAMELCNFGAKVIYPPTIFPVYHKDIPIRIRNTYNLDSPGTYISKELSNDKHKAIKGISSINDTCLITILGLGMVGVIGVNYRIFKALAKAGISVFFVSQASSENTTSIGVKNGDSELASKMLTEEFKAEIELGEINPIKVEKNLATIAIVGENMKHTPGIAGKLFGTLGRNGINVIACAQGASETNISFVISLENLRKTLNVIHDSFFLSEYQALNIFIVGVGLVGNSLIEQIYAQQQKLKDENSLQVKVVGIANSRSFILDRAGIDLSSYKEVLRNSERTSTPEKYSEAIREMNIFNSVFVDCTANEDVAATYKELLDHNVSVVAANKVAASSSYELYEDLKNTARKRGVKFLFETNVGAGLPVINTINDLMRSGDKILKIEAVVSGTLNYIFNVMSPEIPMSRAIKMAQEEGYAEPDPRIDLSGMDVVRKLVILSREAGYRIEQDDVVKELFIPEEYFEGSVEQFWSRISEIDEGFEAKRKELEAEGKKWRFVATLDTGKASIALRAVDSESPFYDLAGSNNIFSFTTERYKEYPMQIKGYGAGAGVTAAGVFADIISIANI